MTEQIFMGPSSRQSSASCQKKLSVHPTPQSSTHPGAEVHMRDEEVKVNRVNQY